MELTFVDLRGSSFAIENPTDIHIRTVEMYIRAQSSDRRKQKDLAQAIRSMIPSLPDHWVSVREFELDDGRNEITMAFNLHSYELLAITNQAAIAYLKTLLVDLKRATPVDKVEEAEIRNQIVRIEKTLKETLDEIKNPILVILKGDEPTLATAALHSLQEGEGETQLEAEVSEETNGKATERSGFAKPRRASK